MGGKYGTREGMLWWAQLAAESPEAAADVLEQVKARVAELKATRLVTSPVTAVQARQPSWQRRLAGRNAAQRAPAKKLRRS